MLRFVFLFFLCLGSHLEASAFERKTYTTIGNRGCDVWTKAVNESRTASETGISKLGTIAQESWAYGFLSAANAFLNLPDDLLKDVNAKLVVDWVSKYCLEHPKKDVGDALGELLVKLAKRENRLSGRSRANQNLPRPSQSSSPQALLPTRSPSGSKESESAGK